MYLIKVSESNDNEIAKRAKTLVFEIYRYEIKSKGFNVFY
jgi:hypothetical protein